MTDLHHHSNKRCFEFYKSLITTTTIVSNTINFLMQFIAECGAGFTGIRQNAYPVASGKITVYNRSSKKDSFPNEDYVAKMQIPTNLLEFSQKFYTEASCINFLIEIRWPDGFLCQECGTKLCYRLKTRDLIECSNKLCCNQVSVTSGTVMHRSKQDFRTWFWGAYLVSTLTPGISALQFQQQLGLKRYETAFNMLHKLRSALVAPNRELLLDEVEVDEAYIGSEEEGHPGRGTKEKILVVCAVEIIRWIDKKSGKERVRAGRIRLRFIPDASSNSLVAFVKENVKTGSIVHTDGWSGYSPLSKEQYDHRPVVQGRGKKAIYMPNVHRIFSNLKVWLLGTYHGGIQKKHIQAYLNEFVYRFNRRFWHGPVFKRALGLATEAECWPTYKSLYKAGEPGGWCHPN